MAMLLSRFTRVSHVQKSVETGRSGWSATWMAAPAVHQLQTDSIKLVEAPLDIYIRILTVEFRTHQTILVVVHL
jgi:hypothetical protein